MQLFLDEIASRYPNDTVILARDGAGWHKRTNFRLPDNLCLLFLPPYSPELNTQEHRWDELRGKHCHNYASTVSTSSKTTWWLRYAISKTLPTESSVSPAGTGFLLES